MYNNKENTNAFLIHISAFTGHFFPFAAILVPLVLWQTQKGKSAFLDHHGKEAVNFNISFALYAILLGLTFIGSFFRSLFPLIKNWGDENFTYNFSYHFESGNYLIPAGFFSIIGLFTVIKSVLIIIAAMKSQKGELYSYPLTIKFIK
ncbi:DUF4870 domain-containing protein [Flavicella sediminum]|uniref:DUF4870 domain-containing protein n=1 Tax=Flavicella sediminum TaxID=2585141 RepID=UPI001123E44A|nr:DUF4870 domain-containing protein [Flavicella sediminum]